jgi:hypothetical protein
MVRFKLFYDRGNRCPATRHIGYHNNVAHGLFAHASESHTDFMPETSEREICEICGRPIPMGFEVFAFTDSLAAPHDGPLLVMCRDCAQLDEQLDRGNED